MKQAMTIERARLPDTPALAWTAAQAFAARIRHARPSHATVPVPVACT